MKISKGEIAEIVVKAAITSGDITSMIIGICSDIIGKEHELSNRDASLMRHDIEDVVSKYINKVEVMKDEKTI